MKVTRRLVQLGFLALTLIGVFYVKGDCERWCPFGGIEALYSYLSQGNMTCSLGVSNFYILGAVLLMTLLLRRVFCSYACPIGGISEFIQLGASKVGIKPIEVPRKLDAFLSFLKYPLIVVILYFTWTANELLFRVADPCYALISRHGKDITYWAYVVSGVVVLLSVLFLVPFCRWLCPMAVILNPFSAIGVARVKRDGETCVDCGLCARECPMQIPVDKMKTVTSARCTSCLDCVAVCPKVGDGALEWGPPKSMGRRWPQAVLIVIMLVCFAGAVGATYTWPFPSFRAQVNGPAPAETKSIVVYVPGVDCRGSSEAFVEWLDRDDLYAIEGFWGVEIWLNKQASKVRITYDPDQTNADAIREAIKEPNFDFMTGVGTDSPYADVRE